MSQFPFVLAILDDVQVSVKLHWLKISVRFLIGRSIITLLGGQSFGFVVFLVGHFYFLLIIKLTAVQKGRHKW